jgi:hypothetical protein
MKKKPKVWLARNKRAFAPRLAPYVLSVKSPLRFMRPGKNKLWWVAKDGDEQHLCTRRFESIAHKSAHLKPGEGPIEIDITIRRKK